MLPKQTTPGLKHGPPKWNLTLKARQVPPVLEVPLHAQLAAAIPLVTTNLTNYTGLIADRAAPPNPNITYHFGFLASDLAVLSDKVSGFYIVLHEMLGEEGPKLCPLNKQSHIKEKGERRFGFLLLPTYQSLLTKQPSSCWFLKHASLAYVKKDLNACGSDDPAFLYLSLLSRLWKFLFGIVPF